LTAWSTVATPSTVRGRPTTPGAEPNLMLGRPLASRKRAGYPESPHWSTPVRDPRTDTRRAISHLASKTPTTPGRAFPEKAVQNQQRRASQRLLPACSSQPPEWRIQVASQPMRVKGRSGNLICFCCYNSTFALSGLERGCLGSAGKPVRPSGRVGRRCVPAKGVGFLQIGRLEWT